MPRKSASRKNAAKKALKMHAVIATRKRAQETEGKDNYYDLTTCNLLQFNILSNSEENLRISDEKTMQLIDLYSKEDCLWNTYVDDYKNNEKRQFAAEKIATILDLPNFTAKHVMMKFKNLRNSYRQELKKIAHSQNSGATGDDLYIPRVFWFAKMDSFIKPHLQEKPQKGEALIYKHNEETEEWIPVNKSKSPIPDTSAGPSFSEDDHSNDSGLKRKRIRVEVPVKQTRAEIQEQKTITQTLKEIQSHLHVLVSHNDDYHDTFGKYVASLLRTLPPQKALDLQPRIVALITKYGIQNLDTEDPLEPQDETEELIIKMDPDDSD